LFLFVPFIAINEKRRAKWPSFRQAYRFPTDLVAGLVTPICSLTFWICAAYSFALAVSALIPWCCSTIVGSCLALGYGRFQ
jgi:hypothetical protein